MTARTPVVTRLSPGRLAWSAHEGRERVGGARAFVRPDGRCFVVVEPSRKDAYEPLLAEVAAEVGRDLHVTVDERNDDARRRLERLGFLAARRESEYLIPTDPALTRLDPGAPPPGLRLVRADEIEEERLRLLDDALRQDVPGTAGWRWDEAAFREETYESPDFDPATYLVAVEGGSGEYAGLVRVWNRPDRSRLGLIAVLAPYRRRGLARALLARAFAVLHERGRAEVSAEVDDANAASTRLLTGLGGRRTGGTVELVRPAARSRDVG